MNTKILIVEDQFIEANNLRNILKNTGYSVSPPETSLLQRKSIYQLSLSESRRVLMQISRAIRT